MDKQEGIYKTLLKVGYNQDQLGSLTEFKSKLDKPSHRQGIYNTLLKIGYNEQQLGSFGDFEANLMGYSPDGSKGQYNNPEWKPVNSGIMFGVPYGDNRITDIMLNDKTVNNAVKETISDPVGAVGAVVKGLGKSVVNSLSDMIEGTLNYASQGIALQDPQAYGYQPTNPVDLQKQMDISLDVSKSIYEFSGKRRKYIDELIPVSDKWQQNFITGDIPQALGSTIAFAATGIIGKSLKAPELLMAGLSGAMAEYQSMGTEAYETTGDVEKARTVSQYGLPIGASESFGLKRFFKILDKTTKTPLLKMIAESGKEGLEEWTQEFLQGTAENITAKEYYDTSRGILDGSFRGGNAGFVTGFLMSMIGHGINRRMKSHPEERELLTETQKVIYNHQAAVLNEVNVNSDFMDTYNDLGHKSRQEANQAIEQKYGLDKKQIERLDESLLESDEALAVKDELFKRTPELFQNKETVYDAMYLAMHSPEGFSDMFGFKPDLSKLRLQHANTISNYIQTEGILNRGEVESYEGSKTTQAAVEEMPLPEKGNQPEAIVNDDADRVFWQTNDKSESRYKWNLLKDNNQYIVEVNEGMNSGWQPMEKTLTVEELSKLVNIPTEELAETGEVFFEKKIPVTEDNNITYGDIAISSINGVSSPVSKTAIDKKSNYAKLHEPDEATKYLYNNLKVNKSSDLSYRIYDKITELNNGKSIVLPKNDNDRKLFAIQNLVSEFFDDSRRISSFINYFEKLGKTDIVNKLKAIKEDKDYQYKALNPVDPLAYNKNAKEIESIVEVRNRYNEIIRQSINEVLKEYGLETIREPKNYGYYKNEDFKDISSNNKSVLAIKPSELSTLNEYSGKDIDPVGICNQTAEITIMKLQKLGFSPYPNHVTFTAKSPVGEHNITHYSALIAVEGKLYLCDMPQSEFIKPSSSKKNLITITKSYQPRFIEVTKENLIKEYKVSEEVAKKNIEIITNTKTGNYSIKEYIEDTQISSINALGTVQGINSKATDNKAVLPAKAKGIDLLQSLESMGIVDPSIARFTKWAAEYAGNPDVWFFDENYQIAMDNNVKIPMGNNPGFYKRKSSTEQHYIGINKNFTVKDKAELYRTLSHELTHAAIDRGLRENRQFLTEMNELVNDLEATLREDGRYIPEFDRIFGEVMPYKRASEFIAYVMSNTSNLRDITKTTPIRNTIGSKFLDRLRNIILNFFRNVLHLKDATYFRGLEAILNKHLGYESQEQYLFKEHFSEELNDDPMEKIEASMDKSFMITNNEKMDPRAIQATAELLGKEKGLSIKDYYSYIRSFKKNEFKKLLLNNPQWSLRAKFYYDKNYRKDIKSLDEFKDRVITSLYNQAHKMDNITVVKLSETIHKNSVGLSSSESMVKEFSDIYTDKNGNVKAAMHPHLLLFDLMPELGLLFGTEFTPMAVDEVETRTYKAGKDMGKVYNSIAKMFTKGKNEKYAKMFGSHGYYYLGNWADKKSIFVLKPKDGLVDKETIHQIGKHYQEKKLVLAEKLLRKRKGDEWVDGMLKNNGTLENVLKVSGDPLYDFIQDKSTQTKIMRLVLEDLRLGGRIIDGKLVSSLYDFNRPETWNGLTMFKRPYLVSLTSYAHEDAYEIGNMLKMLPIRNHGMRMSEKGLMCRSIVFNSKNMKDEKIEVDGKEYLLKDLLLNKFGTERFDGPVYYVKGGLDIIWDKLNGVVKRGVKKGWISNSFTDPEFRNPFYVKGAFHMMPEVDPLSKWMQKNNITFLIASSTAKVNGRAVVNLMDDNIENAVFEIPFKSIQRDNEKSGVKDGATGLPQTFTSNNMQKGNKSFVDMGWNKAIDDIISYGLRDFVNSVSDINYASVIEHNKDKALTGTNEQEKSVAGVLIETVMRKADKSYRDLQSKIWSMVDLTKSVTVSGEALDEVSKESVRAYKEYYNRLIKNETAVLKGLENTLLELSESMGDKFGNFFQEPFFASMLKSYLGSKLNGLMNFKVPASYLVLSPDTGILTPARIDKIRKHALGEFVKGKKEKYKEIEPYRIARNKWQLANQKVNTTVNNPELLEQYKAEEEEVLNELQKYENVTDEYEKELENYFNPDGTINIRTNESKQAIDKILEKYIDENGFLKEQYCMISEDTAKEYGLMTGDNIATAFIPSNNGMSAKGAILAAILNEDLLEPGAIILNSEYAQSLQGKDFDIDTCLLIPKSDAFTNEGYKGFIDTLNATYEKHKTDIKKFYQEHVNSQYTDDPVVLKNNPDLNIYGKQAKLDLILKLGNYPTTQFNESTVFDPLNDAWDILEKFNKQIGLPVNRRKIITFKGSIGLRTKIGNQVLDVNHKKHYQTYQILDVLTHHMVDMPVDTGSFYYQYDEILGFDQDNGTNFYEMIQDAQSEGDKNRIKSTYKAIKNFEKFLFNYTLKLNKDGNLDDSQEVRTYEDGLKYTATQQDINNLLQSRNYDRLLEAYKPFAETDYMMSVAGEYLKNMTIDDINGSPMNKLANQVPLRMLPNVTTSEMDYLLTQGAIINDIMTDNNFIEFKKIFDEVENIPGVKEAIGKIPKSKVIIPGLDMDSNKLLGRMFYMTYKNPKLHQLKAAMISLIYPVDQSTKAKSQVNKYSTEPGTYFDNIYQKTNEVTYPLLFDLLLKNQSYEFKKNAMSTKIGLVTIRRTASNGLVFDYKGKTFDSNDLLNDQMVLPQEARKYIKEQLANEPEARVKLSDLLSLGGRNTSLSGRENLAIELLDKELGNFSEFDKTLFWISLLGKPTIIESKDATGKVTYSPKYPLNLVQPKPSNTDNYHSQNIMLHILGQVKDNISKRFLNMYAEKFNDNYAGRTIKEIQNVTRILKDSELDNDIEVFFHSNNTDIKPILKKVDEVDHSKFERWKMIDNIIRSQKIDFKNDHSGAVDFIIDLLTGEISDITAKEVTDSITAYTTNVNSPFNYEAIAFSKAEAIERNFNLLTARESLADRNIQDYKKQYKTEFTKSLESKDATARRKELLHLERKINTRIAEIIEQNPLGIREISKANDKYIIKTDLVTYDDFNQLLNDRKVGIDRFLYMAAFEYIKRYGVDNIQTMKNFLTYLESVTIQLSTDFGRNDILTAMIEKYQGLIQRFSTLGFTYFPRIVKDSDMQKIIDNIKKTEAEKEVKKRIRDAREKKDSGLAYNKKYDVTDDMIPELVKDYLNEIKSKIVKNQYGDYVFAFQMKRMPLSATDGLYVKDTLKPHEEHQKMFNRMIHTDMHHLNFLVYEFNASKAGRDSRTLAEMKAWTALSAKARHLMTEKVNLDKLKENDRIVFYYNGDRIKGIVSSQDDKYLFLKFDNDIYHQDILNRINDAKRIHDSITKNPVNKTLTDSQKKVLMDLYYEGYSKVIPTDNMSMKDANDNIFNALNDKLNSPETWGRYRKDRIYIRDYDNGQIVNKNGVEKYYSPILPSIPGVIKSIMGSIFLAGPAGATANYVDAQFMLMNDLNFLKTDYSKFDWKNPLAMFESQYGRLWLKGRQYNREFKVALKKGTLDYQKQLQQFMATDKNKLTYQEEKVKYADAVALKVLTEWGETNPVYEFGKEMDVDRADYNNAKGLLKIVGKSIQAIQQFTNAPRNYAERHIRVTAAYMYAYKAIVMEGHTDLKTIESIIHHGVARTQGLYKNIYRKLGEKTEWGSLGMQFTHYNTFMLEQSKKMIEQAVKLDQSFSIKDLLSDSYKDSDGKVHTIYDSVDPFIPGKLKYSFWYNTIGRTFELLMPGLRAGSVMVRPLNIALYTLSQVAMGNWNSDDDGWDTRDLIFSIMSFIVGIGYTLPIQFVYNLFTKDNPSIADVIPVNNRLTNPASTAFELFNSSGDNANEQLYLGGKFEKAMTGFNAVVPTKRKYYSKETKAFQSQWIWNKPGETEPELVIPVLNYFKAHK